MRKTGRTGVKHGGDGVAVRRVPLVLDAPRGDRQRGAGRRRRLVDTARQRSRYADGRLCFVQNRHVTRHVRHRCTALTAQQNCSLNYRRIRKKTSN